MLTSDLRFALRSISRSPGFALAVIVTLGLGIGANTAIFSVVRGVLLRPLPNRDGDRLVYLRQSTNTPGGEDIAFSVPEINDFRESSKSLGGIAEYSPYTVTLVDNHVAERLNVGLVTGNYFRVMGLSPVVGRAFGPQDDGRGAAPVMILTHEYWDKKFAGDPAIVGKTLRVGGKVVTVVGVLQSAPSFPAKIDALMNMVNSEHHLSATMVTGRTHRMTEMVARLAPGATLDQTRAEVAGITDRVHRQYPESYDAGSHFQVAVTPFRDVLAQKAKLTLFLLMGAAGFVLIIACANVANLTLMRGVRREHELVIRAALGAGVARLRKLLLVENLLLALMGSALGLAIAFGGVRMLTALAARYSPRADEIRIDGVVLAFTLVLAVLISVILSFAPSLASEESLNASLSAGARRSTNVRRQRLQQALVVAQVAVSVMLLTGAGLLTRTMQQLSEVSTGLTSDAMLTMEVPKDFNGAKKEEMIADYQRMREQLVSLPGVQQVGLGSTMPLRAGGILLDVKAETHPLAPGEAQPQGDYRSASSDYFQASGIPLLKGRTFTANDNERSGKVAILNKTLADRLFGSRDPIGQRIAWTGDVLRFIGIPENDWRTVVGVVGNTKDGGLDAVPMPAVFIPFPQSDFPIGGFVIRAKGDAAALAPAATKALRQLAPDQPIEHVMTVAQIRDESVAPRRLNAMLVSSFGLLALIVAAVGIAGVLAFAVSARTNEIGIRMSLGADSGRVQRMIISEGGLLVVLGLVLGIVGALSLSRLMQGLLFGVQPHDPVTLVGVSAVMALVGILACWIPALRAARIDPAVALRS
ncbi:MAG: ABC transporter permease [Gemmatimonadaceae bacterium]